ncbi:MAG: ATP-binding protein [Chloroflexota bacterium]
MNTFVGRTREMQTLNQLWQRQDATMLIVYGRRRVGKTSLLTHWLKTHDIPNVLYWVAQPSAAMDQLRQFSQALYQFENPTGVLPETFTYQSWEQALTQVARLAEKDRFTLVLDEFTYLLARTPELAGLFQNTWDHLLKQRNLFLIICGSHLGMMQRHVLAYQAPLYGRAAAQLHVQPLPFGVTKTYFDTETHVPYDAAERVALYAMFGGIPAYWERVDPSLSITDNIRQQLLTPNNLMQAEPRLLLQDFVREPDNYIAIFRAIANGYRTQKEMKTFTGLAQGHISSYVTVLESAGFITRRTPITAGPRSRQSRYHITDPYLRFYYRFLASRQAQLALGVQESALADILEHLISFIGMHTWEEICREWVLRAGAMGTLRYLADQVGSYWDKQTQVDVVGLNQMEKTLILGECKWSPKQMTENIIETLIRKTDAVVPKKGNWRVLYVGMARGGWTPEAQQIASNIKQQATTLTTGKNWQAVDIVLVDLDQIDNDLSQWSTH